MELALRGCSNIGIEKMVVLAKVLLGAGAVQTEQVTGFVEEIGKRFEFHRASFNPDKVDAVSAALAQLYEIFGVAPVGQRQMHDGKSPITVSAATWQKQHQELWDLLVPSRGPAQTLQGEVIRIAGRISRELEGNGGINWDAEFAAMADAFLDYLSQAEGLDASELAEGANIIAAVKRKSGDTRRMTQLAVAWVLKNPAPIALAPPPYRW